MPLQTLIEMVIARGTVPFLVALVYLGAGATVIRRAERGAGVATVVAGVAMLMQVGLTILRAAVLHWQVADSSIVPTSVSWIVLPLVGASLYVMTAGATLWAAVRLARAVRAVEVEVAG